MSPPSEGESARQESPLERQPPLTATMRVSAQERDETVQRLQTAFVEGRLNDEEFDARVRTALAARTRVELEQLLAALPAPHTRQAPPVRPGPVRRGVSLVMAVLGGAARRGRGPEQCTAVAVMGGCSLDLRAVQLSAPVTTINAARQRPRCGGAGGAACKGRLNFLAMAPMGSGFPRPDFAPSRRYLINRAYILEVGEGDGPPVQSALWIVP